jgi:hypothetical protein
MLQGKLQREEEMPEDEIQEKAVQLQEDEEIAAKHISRKADIQRHGDHDEL